jgi:hypothetical protein
MRRFTGDPAFDDTLPVSDGRLEASFRVNPERLARELGDWLTKKKGAGKVIKVELREQGTPANSSGKGSSQP